VVDGFEWPRARCTATIEHPAEVAAILAPLAIARAAAIEEGDDLHGPPRHPGRPAAMTDRQVVPLRPDAVTSTAPSAPAGMTATLDAIEAAAAKAGVLHVDVVLALGLARHLVAVVGNVRPGAAPPVAAIHALGELRLAFSEPRELVLRYSHRG
jgi:hypothetical protein